MCRFTPVSWSRGGRGEGGREVELQGGNEEAGFIWQDVSWEHPIPVTATHDQGAPGLGAEVGMWQGGRRRISFLGERRGSLIYSAVCGAPYRSVDPCQGSALVPQPAHTACQGILWSFPGGPAGAGTAHSLCCCALLLGCLLHRLQGLQQLCNVLVPELFLSSCSPHHCKRGSAGTQLPGKSSQDEEGTNKLCYPKSWV